MTEDAVLDGLMELLPLGNFSTPRKALIQFEDDTDAVEDYNIPNFPPDIVSDSNDSYSNEDFYNHGYQEVFDDTSAPSEFDRENKFKVQNECSRKAKQLKQPGLCSGQACLSEECDFYSLLPDAQNSLETDRLGQHSFSERKSEISTSDGDLSMQNDGSLDVTTGLSYSVSLESIDEAVAEGHHKKITLVSNVSAINEMLQKVELTEEKTQRAISEASQAGNDILVKVEELKEIINLAVEDNYKLAGEVFGDKSILLIEAKELQASLLNISEERNNLVLTIEEMHNTLQRRHAAAEVERAAAEEEKFEREESSQKTLEEHKHLLEAAKEESEMLEQQAQENAKLRELLTVRGRAVDSLHGEMLGIFDSITQLKLRVNTQLPADGPLQQASSSLSSSAFDESLHQQVSPNFSTSFVDVPLQPIALNLSSSMKSACSKSSSTKSFTSHSSCSSATESDISLKEDERTAVASDRIFDLDGNWVAVEDEATISVLL